MLHIDPHLRVVFLAQHQLTGSMFYCLMILQKS